MDFTKQSPTDSAADALRFRATSIDVQNVTGEISVYTHDSDHIELTVEGETDDINKVTAAVNRRGVLEIDGHQGGAVTSITVNGNTTTVISNGTTTITTSHSSSLMDRILGRQSNVNIGAGFNLGTEVSPLKLTLRVPIAKPLNLTLNVAAITTIANLQEKLGLKNTSLGTVHIGNLKDADISCGGSGHVEVKSLNGLLDAHTTSMGNIVIKDGAIQGLDAVSEGSGSIEIAAVDGPVEARTTSMGSIRVNGGTATKAVLSTGGSGKIEIASVNGPVKAKVTSMGGIVIRKGMADSLEATTSGSGSVDVPAAIGDVTLRSSSMGNIRLCGGTPNHLNAHCSGSGSITVDATARTAKLNATSMGNIRVARVIGQVNKASSGSGHITISKEG